MIIRIEDYRQVKEFDKKHAIFTAKPSFIRKRFKSNYHGINFEKF